ncbi:MAG: hypothetical protein HKN58_11815 [Xanthomonadales bacterium]|nr:hypothetical protein [Xanthomonadales bacterium]
MMSLGGYALRRQRYLAAAIILVVTTSPAWASYGQMNLCRELLPCIALSLIFFAVMGIPVAVAIALFTHRRAHPGAAVGRSIAISLLVGTLSYVLAVSLVTVLAHYVDLPLGNPGLAIRVAIFLALVLVGTVPACRRFR